MPIENENEIIEKFKKCKTDSEEFWNPIYKRSAERRKFTLLGKQMEDAEARRFGLKTPMMPNLLLTYVNHEANNTLQTDYLGKVTPNGYGATELMARARQDVLRGLQRMHNTSQVFNFARRDQCATAIAYSIARVEYAGKKGFGKTIKDDYLFDTYNVFPQPDPKTATFSDSEYWIIKEDIPENRWKKETAEEPQGFGGRKKKTIWHFWVKEGTESNEYLMEDGRDTRMEGEFERKQAKDAYGNVTEESPDLQGVAMDLEGNALSRPVKDFNWCWYKITEDFHVVDKEIWYGSHSPVTACTGRKVVDNGQVYYQSMTEFAEVPQKVFTLLYNILMLRLGRSPYSKWLIPFEGVDVSSFDALRKAAVVGDLDILFKSLTADGKTIPAPKEVEPYVIDPIIIQLMQQQNIEIQRIFGIFEANLGERSNEQSGIAIEKRQRGGDRSNYDFLFNFLEYVEQVTRVKLDLIPKYLTAPQQIAFVSSDDQVTMQWINVEGGISFNPDEEYSLAIEASPIAETARREEAEFGAKMAEVSPLIANNPEAMAAVIRAQPGRMAQTLADILVRVDPKLEQAKGLIAQLQKQLQDTTEAAQAKIMQDAVQKQAMQGVITLLRQQMQLLRTANQADKAVANVEVKAANINPILDSMEQQVKTLELQVDKEEADTNRIQAMSERMRVLGDILNPPEASKNGGLNGKFPRPEPSRMFPVRA